MQVNPMNSEEFEVNGRIFIRSTYLDITVLIDKETGYYYAQKICDDNGKRLENLLRLDDYELMKQAVASTTQIRVVDLEITFPGMPVGYRSKWVHKLLVNYIAQWANKEYAVKIAMLLDLIDERLKLENRTLQQEIASEKRLVEQLKTNNGNLNQQVNELNLRLQSMENENAELKQDIDDLINMNLNSNQNLMLLRRDVGHLSNDISDVSSAITEVNERVGVLSINNQKLNTVHDVMIIYFSELKPVDKDKRNDCADDEVWLGTYNGQLSNYKRSVPRDAHILYQIESNRLDSFKFITEHERISPFILDTYQRSIKIYISEFHQFIDEINSIMNEDGRYDVIRNLQVLNDKIKTQERKHKELSNVQRRKQQLLERFDNMHIIVSRYKRLVYAKINETTCEPVNEVENAYMYPWIYKYGANGRYFGEILEPILIQDIFTNETDARIRYE